MPARRWPPYGHDYGDSRHSPLSQITPANVAGLAPVWTFHMRPADVTRGFASSEDTPIVIKDLMHVSTPYGRVVAQDAATGTERWAYQVLHGDQPATRGVSYWPGPRSEIVFGTRSGLLVALDASTGVPIKAFGEDGVADLRGPMVMQGFMIGPGPAIAGGWLYVSSGYGSHAGRGGNVLLAFSAH